MISLPIVNVTLQMHRSWNIARRVDVYVGMCGYRSVPTDVLVIFESVYEFIWKRSIVYWLTLSILFENYIILDLFCSSVASVVPWCHDVVILWFHTFVVSWFCDSMVPWFRGFLLLWCHDFVWFAGSSVTFMCWLLHLVILIYSHHVLGIHLNVYL